MLGVSFLTSSRHILGKARTSKRTNTCIIDNYVFSICHYIVEKRCFSNCTKFTFEFFCEYINFEYFMKDMADKNILEKKISENCVYYCFVDGSIARKERPLQLK